MKKNFFSSWTFSGRITLSFSLVLLASVIFYSCQKDSIFEHSKLPQIKQAEIQEWFADLPFEKAGTTYSTRKGKSTRTFQKHFHFHFNGIKHSKESSRDNMWFVFRFQKMAVWYLLRRKKMLH